MIFSYAATLGLLAQAAVLATTGAPTASPTAAAPIRVWLTDTAYAAGARARVYVQLRDAGYLTVLHVDPTGRIRVLFPLSPDDNSAAPGGATFEVGVLVNAEGGTGTILAARSRWPLQAAGLRAGPFWDYDSGLLFQPTAGDPVAALLDIADRMTDGRPYDSDVTTYRSGGPLAPRDPQLMTPVCLGCVRRRPAEVPPTAVTQSTSIGHSNSVDCSSAVLVNSVCGVIDNRVTNTYLNNQAAPASDPVYVPYYVPFVIPRGRRLSPPPPAARHTGTAAASAMRTPSVVPSSGFLRGIGRRPH